MATTARNADQLGKVQGKALDDQGLPLARTRLYAKESDTQQPVKVFGSSNFNSLASTEGLFVTDAAGKFSFYARRDRQIYVYTLDEKGKVNFRSPSQQPGSWIDNEGATVATAMQSISYADLLAPPTAVQVASAATTLFYVATAPEALYRINGSNTAFVQIAGSGGGGGGTTAAPVLSTDYSNARYAYLLLPDRIHRIDYAYSPAVRQTALSTAWAQRESLTYA